MKFVKKFIKIGGTVQWYMGVVCMLVIMISVTAGVICRKFFNSPLNWVEELCTFLFIYLAFCGASVAAMNKKHVSADFLTTKLSPKANKILLICQRALMILLLAVMFFGAIILQPKMMGHSSTNLDLPKNLYYIPILFSSFYMVCVNTVELIEMVKGTYTTETG